MWCPECHVDHTADDTSLLHLEALIDRDRERRLYFRLGLGGAIVAMLLLLVLTWLWACSMGASFLEGG